jgi:hypothetical protein
MGKTLLHQQPLYLEHSKAFDLNQLAMALGRSKQSLLREAVDDLLKKHAGVVDKYWADVEKNQPKRGPGRRARQRYSTPPGKR